MKYCIMTALPTDGLIEKAQWETIFKELMWKVLYFNNIV